MGRAAVRGRGGRSVSPRAGSSSLNGGARTPPPRREQPGRPGLAAACGRPGRRRGRLGFLSGDHVTSATSPVHWAAPAGSALGGGGGGGDRAGALDRDHQGQLRAGSSGRSPLHRAVPGPGQTVRRLALEVEGRGTIGYPLSRPARPAGGGGRRRLESAAGGRATSSLLEPSRWPALSSGSSSTPLVAAASRGLGRRADGTHCPFPRRRGGAAHPRLSRRPAVGPQSAAPPFAGNALWVEPGPESAHELPFLPLAATAPAVRLTERRLAGSWRVAAPGRSPARWSAWSCLPCLRCGAGRPRQPPAALRGPPDPFPALVAGGARAGARGPRPPPPGERRPAVGGERGGDPPPRTGPAAVCRSR